MRNKILAICKETNTEVADNTTLNETGDVIDKHKVIVQTILGGKATMIRPIHVNDQFDMYKKGLEYTGDNKIIDLSSLDIKREPNAELPKNIILGPREDVFYENIDKDTLLHALLSQDDTMIVLDPDFKDESVANILEFIPDDRLYTGDATRKELIDNADIVYDVTSTSTYLYTMLSSDVSLFTMDTEPVICDGLHAMNAIIQTKDELIHLLSSPYSGIFFHDVYNDDDVTTYLQLMKDSIYNL